MKKSANLLSFLGLLSLSFMFFLPGTQVMAGWDCDEITIDYVDQRNGCGTDRIATINLPYTPNDIANGKFRIEYNTAELTYISTSIAGCLPATNGLSLVIAENEPGVLSGTIAPDGGSAIPTGSTGCLGKLKFEKKKSGAPEIYITELENDLAGWCELPTYCHVNISPEQETVYPGDTIQFSAESFYCSRSSEYTWEVTSRIGTTIVDIGSTIDATGIYTAGSGSGTEDTITVTDNSNGNTGTHTVAVVSCKVTLSPDKETALPNETIQFSASNTGESCVEDCYTWEVTSGAIDAAGLYTAGSDLGTETITVTDTCNSGITAEVTVEVIPCKATIDPLNITVSPSQIQEFTASSQGEACNASCYTWEVSTEGTTGNTTNNSASLYTWSMNVGGATGNTGNTTNTYIYQAGPSEGTDIITVTDTCNGNVSETAVVTIEASTPTTTTTINAPLMECYSDADCANDGLFCNGEANCIRGLCKFSGRPCPNDELFCNGEETCDEENDECISGDDPCPSGICDEDNDICIIEILPECETDTDCDDGLFCNGVETCDLGGICQTGSGNPCADDGLFCTGMETCDEGSDTCISSGAPCTSLEVCNETDDLCAEPTIPGPDPLSVALIPNEAFRSHLIPLPLITLMTRTDENTVFDQTTTVNFGDNTIITPPWTFVLSEDLILIISMITPAGFEATESSNVEVTVTVNERYGTATLTLNTLPFIFGDTI